MHHQELMPEEYGNDGADVYDYLSGVFAALFGAGVGSWLFRPITTEELLVLGGTGLLVVFVWEFLYE